MPWRHAISLFYEPNGTRRMNGLMNFLSLERIDRLNIKFYIRLTSFSTRSTDSDKCI
jgi:hypothetical protein